MLSSGTGRPNRASMSLYRHGNDIRLSKIHSPSNLSAVVLIVVEGVWQLKRISQLWKVLFFDPTPTCTRVPLFLAYFSYENSGFFDEFSTSNNNSSSSDSSPCSWGIISEFLTSLKYGMLQITVTSMTENLYQLSRSWRRGCLALVKNFAPKTLLSIQSPPVFWRPWHQKRPMLKLSNN